MKWLEPLEKFVETIVALWLVELIFNTFSRRSERPTKA